MRIVGGDYKGRRYDGAIPDMIRPTTDNVRESIFNILTNFIDFENLIVADICAGTGFMGFEALSRGAEKCYFFEKNRKAIELIEKISEKLKIEKTQFDIIQGSAEKKLIQIEADKPKLEFDLIFFDPPYSAGLFDNIISILSNSKLVKKGSIFVIESSNLTNLILNDNWNILQKKVYGSTNVLIAEKE